MKKNYIYLALLLIATISVTLLLSNLYKSESPSLCYLYDKLNKITEEEFTEYIIENPDTIIYIADKENTINNKFEKKFVSKLEKLGLIENIVYLDKEEITDSLKNILLENYSYEYKEELPVIIVIIDNEVVETVSVNKDSNVDTIINYEVFE